MTAHPMIFTAAVLAILGGAPAQGVSNDAARKGVQLAQTSESYDRSRDQYRQSVDPYQNLRDYREQNQQRSPFTGRNPAICDGVAVIDTADPAENFRHMRAAYTDFLQQMQLAGGNQAAPNVVYAASVYWCYAGKLGYSQANPPPITPER